MASKGDKKFSSATGAEDSENPSKRGAAATVSASQSPAEDGAAKGAGQAAFESGSESGDAPVGTAKNVTAAGKKPAKPRAASARSRPPKSAEADAAPDQPDAVPSAPQTAGRQPAARKPASPRTTRSAAAKAASGGGDDRGVASSPQNPASQKATAQKPAAKTRAAASRPRTALRSDTRTTTRKKPVARRSPVEVQAASETQPGGELTAARPPKAVVPTGDKPGKAVAVPPIDMAGGAATVPAPSGADKSSIAHHADDGGAGQGDRSATAYFEAVFGADGKLPEKLVQNIERIESLTQRLMKALADRRPHNAGIEGPGAEFYANTAAAWMRLLAEQPARIIGQQVSYWGETLRHFAQVQSALASGQLTAPPDDGPADRRFANPLWQSHPFFNFVKRQYQINADALQRAASDLDIEDMTDRRRIEWFTRQIIDMMAPTNFLATNPDALEKAIETEGESLVRGLGNLVRDIEQSGGEMIVSLSDRDAFRLGENIATTEGRVVARTRLYELIQYAPTTETVHALPVVIFPPWINKFYIMDLKPQNSLIKWIVDQGFTLFVVAWKNPDAGYAATGMDDYVAAYLEVMDRVQDLSGQDRLNAVGYCIAGTTLALTLALMRQRGDERVQSATFFTTLTDFSDQGEFTTFLQDDFVSGIDNEIRDHGLLSSALMQRTFSFLRANDLVWGPAIRSYMLGETPPAFDLLFWNGDGTNLPGRMAMDYLRGLCQQNAFAGDGFTVLGQVVRLADVTLPLCAIACETDHIAPWKDSWRGIARMGSRERTFILSESGHIAGIVNPPSKKKYGHYTSTAGFDGGSASWREQAVRHEGSWWGRWGEWLASRSGSMVPARDPGEGFGPAPGQYVHERP